MKKIITLLLAITAMATAFAREITGKVLSENEYPLDFVNVVLYRDSTYVTGAVTDTIGAFSISTEINGNLTAKVSFVGYETNIATVPRSGNMGVIRLTPSAVQLGEIVVKATRPATTMKGNIAAFVEMAQQFGSLNIGVGLRYEHVKFDYYETGRLNDLYLRLLPTIRNY